MLLLPGFGPVAPRSADAGSTFAAFDSGFDDGAVPNGVVIRATPGGASITLIATSKGTYRVDPNPPLFADGLRVGNGGPPAR